MKVWALIFSAAIAATVIPASAAPDQWPPIKPGYWQVTTVYFSDFQHPVQTNYCIDDKTIGVIEWVIRNGVDRHCTHTKENISGHHIGIDAVCKDRSEESNVHISADFPTSSAFRTTLSVHYIRPNTPDLFIPKTGKLVGACPKDFRPGDAMMNDGSLVHIGPDGKMGPINPD